MAKIRTQREYTLQRGGIFGNRVKQSNGVKHSIRIKDARDIITKWSETTPPEDDQNVYLGVARVRENGATKEFNIWRLNPRYFNEAVLAIGCKRYTKEDIERVKRELL